MGQISGSSASRRAGLIATQAIRGGANRATLARIKETGDVFFAESDRDWVLKGATVHVSMIGFDDGSEPEKVLDGRTVAAIHTNLTANTDVTRAARIAGNAGVAFMGDTKGGAFDVDQAAALQFLSSPNPNGMPSSDVVLPWINGLDVTRRDRARWIVDFGAMEPAEAGRYESTFEHVCTKLRGPRQSKAREAYKER